MYTARDHIVRRLASSEDPVAALSVSSLVDVLLHNDPIGNVLVSFMYVYTTRSTCLCPARRSVLCAWSLVGQIR